MFYITGSWKIPYLLYVETSFDTKRKLYSIRKPSNVAEVNRMTFMCMSMCAGRLRLGILRLIFLRVTFSIGVHHDSTTNNLLLQINY